MKNIFNIRIPSIFGIVLLLIGVGVTSYLVDQGIIFEGRAAPEKTPSNIAITNVTSTSFTVIYTTEEAVPGTLTFGTTPEGTGVAFDDRDKQAGKPTPSKIHQITVPNLEPEMTYYFTILSGDAVFKNNNEPYEITTAPVLPGAQPPYTPVSGSVRFAQETDKQELLILIQSDTMQSLSTIVAADDAYTLPLTGVRSNDLSAFATLSDTSVVSMKIFSGQNSSDVKVLFPNMNPVPLILFGENYDFTISTEPLAKDITASQSAETVLPTTQNDEAERDTVQILTPEASTFSDQQPVFTGTAIPGEAITVTIHSEEAVTATITAGTDGNWEYRPDEPLTPGEHTITIKSRDITGTLREFTRSFTVLAQGSQFIDPSVSPTRTPTPTLVLTSPTIQVTTTVQPTVLPSATPTIAVTATPVPTIAAVSITPEPTRPPIAPTGSTEVLIGGVMGAIILVAGFILFFITKGSLL